MTRTTALAAPVVVPVAALMLAALPLAACAPAADRGTTEAANEQGAMQRSVDELTLSIRLKAAEVRIVQLERQVGALEATPAKIENQLLTSRIEQLEGRVYAGAPGPDANRPPPTSADRRPRPEPTPTPTPTPLPNRFNPFGL